MTAFKTTTAYDSLDRMISLVYPDNDRVAYRYNRRGLLKGITGGPSGFIVKNAEYRPSGQLARCEYGNGVMTDYEYDPRQRLVDLRSHAENLVLDGGAANDLVHYAYTLDDVSNVVRIDDKRPAGAAVEGNADRNTQIFGYDQLYRLARVRYSLAPPGQPDGNDGTIDYSYDAIGNMLSEISTIQQEENGLPLTNLGAMTYGGAAGRSDRVVRRLGDPPGPHALTFVSHGARNYPYDSNGNITSIEGKVLSWDFKDRLVAVDSPTTHAEYVYDYAGRRTTKKVSVRGAGAVGPTTDAVLYVGRHFEMREHDQPVKYVFTGDTRVAEITGSLDAGRERVQRFRLHAGWNLIALAVDTPDAVTQLGFGGDGRVQALYRWDISKGNFVRLNGTDAAPSGSVLWVEAPQDLQVQVRGEYTVSTSVPVPAGVGFVPGPGLVGVSLNRVLGPEVSHGWLFDASAQRWGVSLKRDAHEPPVISNGAKVLAVGGAVFLDAAAAGELVLPPPAHGIRYYHHDHLGSSSVVTDALGAILRKDAFYPFGLRRQSVELAPDSGVPGVAYLFEQKELDSESGLQYFEARYLAGPLGRFLSVDPKAGGLIGSALEDPQILNSYGYALNNPIRITDPDGMQPLAAMIKPINISFQLPVLGGVSFSAGMGITANGSAFVVSASYINSYKSGNQPGKEHADITWSVSPSVALYTGVGTPQDFAGKGMTGTLGPLSLSFSSGTKGQPVRGYEWAFRGSSYKLNLKDFAVLENTDHAMGPGYTWVVGEDGFRKASNAVERGMTSFYFNGMSPAEYYNQAAPLKTLEADLQKGPRSMSNFRR